MTSADLELWIASRGSTVTLVRCPGNDTPDVASSAVALGIDVACVVKSLVFACDGEFVVVVTNGEARVDPKKLARRLVNPKP
jgi:prolyl-tRNA editing enzyme YbaK/EbsC (Cys-tRNA(Pro) deacylase)